MDCEGCEYESILKCPDKILQRFQQIFLEYHYGYKNLQKKLERCGFRVEITESVYHKNPYAENKNMFIGDIRASKIS